MGKRFLLFILTNILVLATITIVFSIISVLFPEFDLRFTTPDGGIGFAPILIFSALIGFGGAFISLGMSRMMAKKMMKVKVLDPSENLSRAEQAIVDKVHRLSRNAELVHMPEVGIYQSPEVNAFATGPTRSRSLVAVSTGLLQSMDDDAVEGVIAHEVAHVTNGDMITMTLLQGVINTFVVFLSRVAAIIVSRFVQGNMQHVVRLVAAIAFQILFSILGSIIVMAFSRYREFHADRGGADLAGKDKMVHALRSLARHVNKVDNSQPAVQTLKISNKGGISKLFSSHPDLKERIRRLEAK